MSNTLKVSILFTACSMIAAVCIGTSQDVAAFAIAAGLTGFIANLERRNSLELERFEQDIKKVNDQLTNIAMSSGWKI